MSRYEDLRQVYAEVKDANDHYWHELRDMIRNIGTEFSSYLDVGKDLIDVAGTKKSAVTIGAVGENSTLKPWAIDSLPKKDGSIEFALCLSFPYAADAEPKPEFVYELSIWRDSKGFWVKRAGWFDESFFGPSFTGLYEHLISATAATILEARR